MHYITVKQPNIILVVLDTMRIDGLGCYNPKVNTPNFNAFCSQAVVYRNAIAPSPWTVPSHASMFTGKYPSDHGVHENMNEKVFPKIFETMSSISYSTLAEELRRAGYNTFGLTSNATIMPGTGFDRGFNAYMYNSGPIDTLIYELFGKFTAMIKQKYGSTSKLIKGMLSPGELIGYFRRYRAMRRELESLGFPMKKGGDSLVQQVSNSSFETPIFMFLNFMEMHEPYMTMYRRMRRYSGVGLWITLLNQMGRLDQKVIESTRKDYYKEAELLDSYFGILLKYLKDQGVYESSLIIVTSDHGQSLLESGFFGHGIYLHDELVRVPLIIKYPGEPLPDDGYFNIKDIFRLALSASRSEPLSELLRDVTFSESFGSNVNVSDLEGMTEQQRNAVMKMAAPRKAVFKSGYKLVVNGLDGSIEEFTYNGRIADRKMANDLIDELRVFRGRQKFVLPG